MSEFTNTVDIVGDDALTDSIIDRSIDECRDNTVSLIGSYVFQNCSLLATADFPAATSIGKSAFNNCSSLTTADFPAVTSIGVEAFYNCSALTTANFPAATSVGDSAFNNCSSLTTANFSAATSFGGMSFLSCRALTTLILRNTAKLATMYSTYVFRSTPIESGTGYIYVPRSLVDSYKSANYWSTYANQFRALEDWTIDGTVMGELDIANRRMVRFFNDDGTLLGYKVVAPGSDAVYDGTPVCSTDASWEFTGFEPAPTNVTADIDCYAQYSEPIASGTFTTGQTWKLMADGTLTIAGTGNLPNYWTASTAGQIGYEDSPIYKYRNQITKVVVAEGITGIGDMLFRFEEKVILTDTHSTYIASVSLPSTLTRIGQYAFANGYYGEGSLTTITIPANVVEIGQLAFYRQTMLTSAIFENPNGWKRGSTAVDVDLADPTIAAQYISGMVTTTMTRS